jgi:hypothetical protein
MSENNIANEILKRGVRMTGLQYEALCRRYAISRLYNIALS